MAAELTPETRYQKYAAWCRSLGIQPAEFIKWLRGVAGIPHFTDYRPGDPVFAGEV